MAFLPGARLVSVYVSFLCSASISFLAASLHLVASAAGICSVSSQAADSFIILQGRSGKEAVYVPFLGHNEFLTATSRASTSRDLDRDVPDNPETRGC